MTPEGKVRQYLKKQAKALGLEHRKLKWIARKGAPDEFVFKTLSEGVRKKAREHSITVSPVCAFIECKRPPPWTYENGQEREIERLRNAGFAVFVVDSEATVDAALRSLVNP